MRTLPHVASRVLGTPLLIAQAKLEAILAVLGPRIGIDVPSFAQRATEGKPSEPSSVKSATGLPSEAAQPRRRVTPSGIAVIPVFGTLVKRTGPIEAASGLTSYGDLEAEVLDAVTDPAVRAVVLDVDSPGGEASGAFDLADLVYDARALKPIWAVADEQAFSGAYAIASAAERVIVPRTAGVGSIGVIAVHVDQSARDAMQGYRYTTVFAGAAKNDFNPHEPLGGAAQASLQTEVDRVYQLFAETVARNRGLTAEAVRATEASLFFGTDAVSAGLADEVGTLRDAIAVLSNPASSPRRITRAASATVPRPTLKEDPMTDEPTTGGEAAYSAEAAASAAKAGPPTQTELEARPPASASPVRAQSAPAKSATARPVPVKPAPADGPGTGGPGAARNGAERPGTGEAEAPTSRPAESPAAPNTGADVIDLDEVRGEARGEGYREAATIVELCALAGMPERAGEMIARGLSVEDARKELLGLKAQGVEVQSHVMPGAGTGQTSSLEDNPVVRAARARASAARATLNPEA